MSDQKASEQFEREARFHDAWAEGSMESGVLVEETLHHPTAMEMNFLLSNMGDLRGKKVLDLGCGLGEAAILFASLGANVTASDISPGMLACVEKLAAERGLRVDVLLGSAEGLNLPDAAYDIVYTGNTLHHLADMDHVLRQAHRALKPGGLFCSWDPVRYNPVINIYRRMASAVRTPDEMPLGMGEIAKIRSVFPGAKIRFFWLTTLVLFVKFFAVDRVHPNQDRYWKRIYKEDPKRMGWWKVLARLDSILLRLPGVRWLAWNVAVVARKAT